MTTEFINHKPNAAELRRVFDSHVRMENNFRWTDEHGTWEVKGGIYPILRFVRTTDQAWATAWLFYYGAMKAQRTQSEVLANAQFECLATAKTDEQRAFEERVRKHEAFMKRWAELKDLARAEYILVTADFNWADEMDLAGMQALTRKELRRARGNIKHCKYPVHQSLGTNEDMEWTSASEVWGALKMMGVDKRTYDNVRRLIGSGIGKMPRPFEECNTECDEDED